MCAETAQHGAGHGFADDEQSDADRERHPERLCCKSRGALLLSGAARPRDDCRRPVRQEVEDRERAREDRAGEPQRRDLRAAEVTDDRGVDQDVQRLRRERAERGQRQPEDLAVVRRAAHEPQSRERRLFSRS